MKKGQSMETITLEEALDLFKLPRKVGEFEDKTVTIGTGRFGPYVYHNSKYVSLPKTYDPLEVTLDEAIELILAKREAEAKKHIKKFDELLGKMGKSLSTTVNHYNNSYKELAKIDKDVVKIAGGEGHADPVLVDKPQQED
jgi:DNA topoisomerase-1